MTPYKDRSNPEVLVLFDVDGTLTPAREVVELPLYSRSLQ